MTAYIVRRLAIAVFLVIGATFITFMLTRVIPSDPVMTYVGRFATQQQVERARIELGLDRPWYVQYGRYLGGLFRGDWGVSLRTHRPVSRELLERLPASIELIVASMVLGLSGGILLGMLSAAKPRSALDNAARVVSVSGVALPQFWFAMILQLIVGQMLGWMPLSGRIGLRLSLLDPVPVVTGFMLLDTLIAGRMAAFSSALSHLVLPAVSLAAYPLAMSARLVRAKLLEILSEDYIRTTRAFGIHEAKVFARYALRNAIPPIATMSALSFVFTLVGTFLVENIFSWPGVGSYTAVAILSNDISVVMSMTLLIAVAAISLNLLVDLFLAWVDPRIRLK